MYILGENVLQAARWQHAAEHVSVKIREKLLCLLVFAFVQY